jgi:hypothetical protein
MSPAGSDGVADRYSIDGPESFGDGLLRTATSAAGSLFVIIGADTYVGVPQGYAGEALAGTVTFAGATFDSLGITPGEYVFSLPKDTVTLRFAPTAVIPLPASLPLLLGALGAAAFAARSRA